LKEKDLILILADYMEMPIKTVMKLVKTLKQTINYQQSNSIDSVIPRLGRITRVVRAARNRHNINTDSTTLFPSKTVVKMVRFGYGNQALTDTWGAGADYKSYSIEPGSSMAEAMNIQSDIDLLICNQFINELASVIIDSCSVGETIKLSKIGSFKKKAIKVRGIVPPVENPTWIDIEAVPYPVNFVGISIQDPDAWFLTAERPSRLLSKNRGPSVSYYSIKYAEDQEVIIAVGSSVSSFAWSRSLDGLNWIDGSPGFELAPFGLAYSIGLGLFVAAGYASDGFNSAISSDGMSWTRQSMPYDFASNAIEYSESWGIFVAVGGGTDGSRVAVSSDGTTWSTYDTGSGGSLYGVTWSEQLGIWVAVGDLVEEMLVIYSEDGIVWSIAESLGNGILRSVAWSDELEIFTAVGYFGILTIAIYSTDGVEWFEGAHGQIGRSSCVTWVYNINKFIALSFEYGDKRMMSSADGQNWDSATVPPTIVGTAGMRDVINFRPSKKLKELVN
jgi:nucleoid DNA-binding protein